MLRRVDFNVGAVRIVWFWCDWDVVVEALVLAGIPMPWSWWNIADNLIQSIYRLI